MYLPTSPGDWLYWNRSGELRGPPRPHSLQGEASKDIAWGDLHTRVNATGEVLSVAWVDHGPVLFLNNASDPSPQVQVLRKRPAETASWGKLVRAPFGNQATKKLPIPSMINFYNHNMNGVDRGDQLRALGKAPRRNKGWKALFYDSIQLFLCNAYLLSKHHPQGCPKELLNPIEFKRAVIEVLISGGGNWGVRSVHPRLHWHFIEDEKPPPMVLRGHEVHKRVKMPQRACRVCRRNRGAMKGGLTARRIPLSDLNPNTLPRVSRSTSGCQDCGVSLCVRGNCWEAWHRSPRGLQGA